MLAPTLGQGMPSIAPWSSSGAKDLYDHRRDLLDWYDRKDLQAAGLA